MNHYEPTVKECLEEFGIDEVHPAADLFPLMSGDEFGELVDSIGEEGLEEDIILTHDGKLLDGRNRLRACFASGMPPRFRRLSEIYADDYIGFVVRLNIHRRHLTASQKGAIAYEAKRLFEEEAKERQRKSGIDYGKGGQKVVATLPQPMPTGRAVVATLPQREEDPAWSGEEDAGPTPTPAWLKQPETASAPVVSDEKTATIGDQQPQDTLKKPAPKARDMAAEAFGASPRYVQDAQTIHKADPEAFQKVKSGELTIPKAKAAIKEKEAKPKTYITLSQWKDQGMHEVPEVESSKTFNRQGDSDEDSMGNIEWAKWSWNPVTGCKHDCSYCYARDIAARFYEQGFEPSLIPERLRMPYNTKVPGKAIQDSSWRNVFANSMSDLYGRWVPQEWIDAVFKAMADNPQWNFLTLTKFPKRAAQLTYPENVWIGTSVDLQARVKAAEEAFERIECGVRWLSIEPMIEPLQFNRPELFDWVVIGGASKSTKTPDWTPPFSWIVRLAAQFLDANPDVKIYLKTNGRPREMPGVITQHNADESFFYLGKK